MFAAHPHLHSRNPIKQPSSSNLKPRQCVFLSRSRIGRGNPYPRAVASLNHLIPLAPSPQPWIPSRSEQDFLQDTFHQSLVLEALRRNS